MRRMKVNLFVLAPFVDGENHRCDLPGETKGVWARKSAATPGWKITGGGGRGGGESAALNIEGDPIERHAREIDLSFIPLHLFAAEQCKPMNPHASLSPAGRSVVCSTVARASIRFLQYF